MVLWGWGRENGVTFCLFCGLLVCHSPLIICHIFQNAVFQSYIYMLCGIWPASILLNKVLRLSEKNKTKQIHLFDLTVGIRWNAWSSISHILTGVHQNQSKMAEYRRYPAATLCIPKKKKKKIITVNEERTSCCCFLLYKYGLFCRNPLERVCHQVSLRCSPVWLSV